MGVGLTGGAGECDWQGGRMTVWSLETGRVVAVLSHVGAATSSEHAKLLYTLCELSIDTNLLAASFEL